MSLDTVNITWRIPMDNNAHITSYTLTLYARLSLNDKSHLVPDLIIIFPVTDLTRIGKTQLRFTYPELLTEKLYEVVIRAENSVGAQMDPVLGDGFTFSSAFPNDGRVENVRFIPTTRLVIVTWNLPTLALDTTRLNVSFNITYFKNDEPDVVSLIIINYNSKLTEQGVSIDLLQADSAVYTVNITALYTVPDLVSSTFSLSPVRTLDSSKFFKVM